MANSMPFNSVSGDRKFKAEDWAWYFGTFIGNGVFPKPETGLQVVVNEDMKVTVKEGKAFINGYAFKNASDYEITLDTADGALGRIDRVIVRWDLTKRDIYIQVLKGTVSVNPVPQDITRSSEIYDLVLADITIAKGVTSIAQANITDQRYNSNICGIVKGTVEGIDASVLTAQFEDFTKTYQEQKLAEFEEWVESIKDVLGEDTAGNLQLQIDDVNEKATEHIENTDNPHNIIAEQIPINKEISGMSADNVQGAIDELATNAVMPVTSPKPFSNLSQVGWYRVAKLECEAISQANGSMGNSCDLEINRPYMTGAGEYHRIQVVSLYQKTIFCNEVSGALESGLRYISKIRQTVDTDTNTTYLEIYYNTTNANRVVCTISNHMNTYAKKWELITPTLTSETLNNVTVLGTHEFKFIKNDIQSGYVSFTGLTAGGVTTKTIPFPSEFTHIPNVIAILTTSSFDANVRVRTRRTNNFDVDIKLPSSMTSVAVMWFASIN